MYLLFQLFETKSDFFWFQLATALEFIKHAGVVHADLKPENIMMVDHVRQPLRIKIIDFGIACRDPEARTDQILQTLWYR